MANNTSTKTIVIEVVSKDAVKGIKDITKATEGAKEETKKYEKTLTDTS